MSRGWAEWVFYAVAAAVVAAVLVNAGCKPGDAKNAQRDFCSDAAYRATRAECRALFRRARTDAQVDAVEGYCTILYAAQEAACNEVNHEGTDAGTAGGDAAH